VFVISKIPGDQRLVRHNFNLIFFYNINATNATKTGGELGIEREVWEGQQTCRQADRQRDIF
jgi:hypothetical protein